MTQTTDPSEAWEHLTELPREPPTPELLETIRRYRESQAVTQTNRDRMLLAISEVHSGNREEGERIVDAVMPEIERLRAALSLIAALDPSESAAGAIAIAEKAMGSWWA